MTSARAAVLKQGHAIPWGTVNRFQGVCLGQLGLAQPGEEPPQTPRLRQVLRKRRGQAHPPQPHSLHCAGGAAGGALHCSSSGEWGPRAPHCQALPTASKAVQAELESWAREQWQLRRGPQKENDREGHKIKGHKCLSNICVSEVFPPMCREGLMNPCSHRYSNLAPNLLLHGDRERALKKTYS